jgi:DnaJ family protein A protein 5
MGKENLSKEEMEEASYGFNIWPLFSANCYKGFNDEKDGFYTVYREAFEKLKYEEE